jgi:HPt (histidine-containing phosphotransfer) domain-containing protein
MPMRSGIEVVQAIRVMEPPGKRMPAMILSASVTIEARERARAAGADEFVSKPFDAAQLIRKIDDLGKAVPADAAPPRTAARAPTTAARFVDAGVEQSPLVDARRLEELEDIARDSSFVTELFRGFRGDVEALLVKLEPCIESGDKAKLADLTHTLKGAAVGVGAKQLASHCVAMDRLAETAGKEEMLASAKQMRKCFADTVAFLAEYVRDQHQLTL